MSTTDWLRFEITVMDMLDEEYRNGKIHSLKDVSNFLEELHSRAEIGIQDYIEDMADEAGWDVDDYNPMY